MRVFSFRQPPLLRRIVRLGLATGAAAGLLPWGSAALLSAAPSGAASPIPPPVEAREVRLAPGLDAHFVRLERGRCALRVVELEPGETMAAAAERLAAAGANPVLAAVNGGYFTPERKPLGLVVSRGVERHGMEASRILTGLLAVVSNRAGQDEALLLRNEELQKIAGKWGAKKKRTKNSAAFPALPIREALQAGPFLVDRGGAVPGLNATRAAERTVLLADDHGVFALLSTGPVTLAELGCLLADAEVQARAFGGAKIERALNLDGGSSTALWVRGGVVRAEWKAVRNAVFVVEK